MNSATYCSVRVSDDAAAAFALYVVVGDATNAMNMKIRWPVAVTWAPSPAARTTCRSSASDMPAPSAPSTQPRQVRRSTPCRPTARPPRDVAIYPFRTYWRTYRTGLTALTHPKCARKAFSLPHRNCARTACLPDRSARDPGRKSCRCPAFRDGNQRGTGDDARPVAPGCLRTRSTSTPWKTIRWRSSMPTVAH